jgi:tetratricopeptide (TPR) repeat protein
MKRVPILLLFVIFGASLIAGYDSARADSYTQGLEALAVGDTQKAIRLFSQAISAKPDEFHIYNDRGVAYKMTGNPERALADYTKALELKPGYANALNNRGVIYLQKDSYDKAIEDFTEALKSSELKSKIQTNLGIAYARKGDPKEAVKHLEAALSSRPLDHRAFLFMAESLEQLGEREKAAKMYQLSIGLTKDSTTADMIENKIAQLEGKIQKVGSPKSNVSERRNPIRVSPDAQWAPFRDKGSLEPRHIFRAAPVPGKDAVQPNGEASDAIDSLNRLCRSKMLEEFSPASAQIYNQGLQFLEKADPRKALIRFEDALQLERRRRNQAAVAWNSLELGRTYLKIGDHVTAETKLQDALKIFRRIKASDAIILTMLEIAAVKKSAGQNDRASEIYSLAKEQAVSREDSRLAKAINDLASGKVRSAAKRTAAGANETLVRSRRAPTDRENIISHAQNKGRPDRPPEKVVAREEIKNSVKATVPPTRTESTKAGIAPANSAETRSGAGSQTKKREETNPRKIMVAKHRSWAGDKPLPVETKVGGEQVVGKQKEKEQKARADQQKPSGKASLRREVKQAPWDRRVKENLAELEKYKGASDEVNMIMTLEKLAELYIGHRQYEKALHSLVASIAYRERTGLNKGLEKLYEKRGLVKERLGDSAGALADLTRALVLFDGHEGLPARRALESRIRKIATGMRMDPTATMVAYQALWRARSKGDDRAETLALYTIGRLYDRAGINAQALSYYDQSSASILADKARVYEKIGQKELAAESYKSALEAFKKLDYSRYLSLLKKAKTSETLSLR